MPEDVVAANNNEVEETAETEGETALGEGYIIDHITGEKELKATPKEQVRQFIAQALKNQYAIPYEDMRADFVISGGGKKRVVTPSRGDGYSSRQQILKRPEMLS